MTQQFWIADIEPEFPETRQPRSPRGRSLALVIDEADNQPSGIDTIKLIAEANCILRYLDNTKAFKFYKYLDGTSFN